MTSNEIIKLESQIERFTDLLNNMQENIHDILTSQQAEDARLRQVEIDIAGMKKDLEWISKLKMPTYLGVGGSIITGIFYAAMKYLGH